MKIIDCQKIRDKILDRETVKRLKGKTIHVVMQSRTGANNSYLKSIQRTAEQYGVMVKVYTMPIDKHHIVPKEDLDDVLRFEEPEQSNFVLFMGYEKYQIKYLVTASRKVNWEQVLDPPAAPDVVEAVNRILEKALGKQYSEPWDAVIIGRSRLAKKMCAELLENNYTVTMCHTQTKDIKAHCKRADIIISFAGSPGLITTDMVKDRAVIISVGCSFIDGKIYGDIELDAMKCRTVSVTPTPGGVGQVCTAVMFETVAGNA